MAKVSGGTRNYSTSSKPYNTRLKEFQSYMDNPDYDPSRSEFFEGGGFKVTHKEHNKEKNDPKDREIDGVNAVAKKGYRVYQDSEKSMTLYDSKKDGRVEKYSMDVKTINEAGPSTIKSKIEKATKQGASCVILVQNTEAMTRSYVESQLKLFKELSPQKAREKLELVIVVSKDLQRIHRHKMK